MEQLPTTSILALFETDKAQRLNFIESVMSGLEEGNIEPLKVHMQLKSMEEIINAFTVTDPRKKKYVKISKRYKTLLLSAAETYGKKFQVYNAAFEIKETGTKYDYSMCNDRRMNELLIMQDEIDKQVKERAEFLKKLPIQGVETLVDDEVITIYPPAKSSTTSLTISLK